MRASKSSRLAAFEFRKAIVHKMGTKKILVCIQQCHADDEKITSSPVAYSISRPHLNFELMVHGKCSDWDGVDYSFNGTWRHGCTELHKIVYERWYQEAKYTY